MKQKILLSFILIIISFNLFSQVGINTNDPKNTLDVNGDVRIRKIENSLPNEKNYTLVSDESGIIKKISSSSGNSYAFNYLTYKINNVNGDWVQDLDTKIPSSEYVVTIVGSSFSFQGLKTNGNIAGATYNPLKLEAVIKNGTWHLSADYDGGGPADGKNGNWNINVLIISKSVIKHIPDQSIDLGGKSTGTMTSIPPGI